MKYSTLMAMIAALLTMTACTQMQATSMQASSQSAGVPPGGPYDPVPPEYLRGTEFDGPNMTRFSWGMGYNVANETPEIDYQWPEVRRRLAARNR